MPLHEVSRTVDPGSQLAYVEFTSNVTVSATAEGSADVVVSAGALIYDGSAVWVEFYSPLVEPNNAAASSIVLYVTLDGTSQGIFWWTGKDNSALSDRGVTGCFCRRKLTPSAGEHTLRVAATRGVANGLVYGGAGGSGNYMPGYIRIYKA